jgi:cytochrome c-type biogenesis protein CcmH/NrfG
MMAGYFALQNKDFESARKHFEALTFYDPDYAMGWTLLGDTYRSLNDITRAKAAYEQALRLTPNNADAARALQQLSG